MEQPFENALKKSEFTPLELVYRYLKYLPWILISALISLVIAFIYLRYTPVEYSARGKMIIKSVNPFGSQDERFNNLMLMDAGPNLNNEMVILRSTSLVQRVIQSLDLETQYSGVGKVRATLLYKASPVQLVTITRTDSASVYFKVNIIDESTYRLNDEEKVRNFGELINNKNGVFKILLNKPYLNIYDTKEFVISNHALDVAAEYFIPAITVLPVNEKNTYTGDCLSIH